MKQKWDIMGMPIVVVIEDDTVDEATFKEVYDYFCYVDEQYSPYKATSEVSKINAGLPKTEWSEEMKTVLQLCQDTKHKTKGYFEVFRDGKLDPSGLVKGWAINNAATMLKKIGHKQFYIDAGGDIQAAGRIWKVGIRNPFETDKIVKVVAVSEQGVATSGNYLRGQHIYNPHSNSDIEDIASMTVIGPNVYDADRFATAAFSMGSSGIDFIESLPNYEAYMIDNDRQATLTSGFERYIEATA